VGAGWPALALRAGALGTLGPAQRPGRLRTGLAQTLPFEIRARLRVFGNGPLPRQRGRLPEAMARGDGAAGRIFMPPISVCTPEPG
jgi:hypothetical protein